MDSRLDGRFASRHDADGLSRTESEFAEFVRDNPYRRLDAGGGLDYLDCGRGPAVLLLSGLFGRGESWFPLIVRLRDRFRLLAPNYGRQVSLQGYLEALASLLDELELKSAAVLGQSFGGMIAQVLVRRTPGRVSRLILSHTAPPPLEMARWIRPLTAFYLALPLGLNRRLWEWRIRRWTRRHDASPDPFWDGYRKRLLAEMEKDDLRTFGNLFVGLLDAGELRPEDLDGWPGEILIIRSDQDPAVPEEANRKLAAGHPAAGIHTFRGTGHGSLIADPDGYATVVSDFLSGERA